VARLGASRDLDWISLDPLVPMGDDPRESVLGAQHPPGLLARARDEGVFGVLGRLALRRARATTHVLALPGAAWLNGWPECATEHPRLGTICVRRRSILASTRIDNGVTTVQSTSRTIREMGMNAAPPPESRRKACNLESSVPVPRLG
jgi:hypothetical protein